LVTSAVGALLAVTIGVGLPGCRWPGPVSDEYAAETARGICASEVERVGGVVGDLRVTVIGRVGASVRVWLEGATVRGRAVRCMTDGYPQGGWVADVSLTYLDGTPV
jgi:hypothetical protein